MDTEERKAKALKLFEDLENLMDVLYERWQSEKDYEDINEYGERVKQNVDEIGGEFIKMSKRPFGFTYKLADATYQVTMKSGSYAYKRIA